MQSVNLSYIVLIFIIMISCSIAICLSMISQVSLDFFIYLIHCILSSLIVIVKKQQLQFTIPGTLLDMSHGYFYEIIYHPIRKVM